MALTLGRCVRQTPRRTRGRDCRSKVDDHASFLLHPWSKCTRIRVLRVDRVGYTGVNDKRADDVDAYVSDKIIDRVHHFVRPGTTVVDCCAVDDAEQGSRRQEFEGTGASGGYLGFFRNVDLHVGCSVRGCKGRRLGSAGTRIRTWHRVRESKVRGFGKTQDRERRKEQPASPP